MVYILRDNYNYEMNILYKFNEEVKNENLSS